MSVSVESSIFDFNQLETSIGTYMSPLCNVDVQGKYDSKTNETPRVTIELRIGKPTGNRFIGWAAQNSAAPFCPLNSFNYELDVTVATNRTTNGIQHNPLIGKCRWALQYYNLLTGCTPAAFPYHTFTSCDELGPQQDSIIDEGNIQQTKLTFYGVFNIRDSAWPPAPSLS